MNVNITARGFDLVQGTKDGIHEELQRVSKMLPENVSYDVTLRRIERNGKILYNCDIIVRDGAYFAKGEAREKKIEWAVDKAVDALKRRLRRVKTAMIDKSRSDKHKEFNKMLEKVELSENALREELEAEDKICSEGIMKRKNFTLNMMSEEEAQLQLELLGHEFFAFKNETGVNCILYRSNKGYGLITLS